jgi:hypothetical protein
MTAHPTLPYLMPHAILGLIPIMPLHAPPLARAVKEKPMLATITISGQVSAQGTKLWDHPDGRVTILTGTCRLTGWPIARLVK